MINMNMPDFLEGRMIYGTTLDLMRDYPQIFHENTKIASIFGCFPGCIWNGGSTNFYPYWFRREIEWLIRWYNEVLNIPIRFTFTNPLIQEKHLDDAYGNLIAELGHNGRNEILTSSRILENYLREKYPNYKYCASIVGTDTEPYATDPHYGLVVMGRRMNNNWDYLDTVPWEDRAKIEFLCNDPCPSECTRIYSHYRDLGRAQIEMDPAYNRIDCSMMGKRGVLQRYNTRHLDSYISREMIINNYLPKGYNQFKVSGRGNVWRMISNICEYLVKPEYWDDVVDLTIAPHMARLDDENMPELPPSFYKNK